MNLVEALFSICRQPMSLEQAMAGTLLQLASAAERIIRLFLASRSNRLAGSVFRPSGL